MKFKCIKCNIEFNQGDGINSEGCNCIHCPPCSYCVDGNICPGCGESENVEEIIDKIFYRCEYDNFLGQVVFKKYVPVRESQKSYWLVEEKYKHYNGSLGKTVVMLKEEGRKRFARKTQKEALQSYIARTQMRIQHLERQLYNSGKGLRFAENLNKKNEWQ